MQATGSVTWVVGAQASVLGRCSGGLLCPSSPSSSSSSSSSASSGRFQGLGVVRCCVQAQDKKPRVRKTKEERREMVESFVNTYRVSNNGKFPSVNLTHKEVGGSYYIVREIVRDIIQENRVLGPGGLNAKALSFEDSPDYSELSASHELGQENIEILDLSDENQGGKDSVLEMSDKEGVFSLENNAISTEQLVGSSNFLQSGILNGVVQNGNVGSATCLDTNLQEEDEALCGKLREVETIGSEKQAPSFVNLSDLHKDIDVDGSVDADKVTTSSITDEVTLLSEPSTVSQTNGAHLHEHVTLSDNCDDISNSAVDEAIPYSETNGVLQTNQTLVQEQEKLPETESIMTGDVHFIDGKFRSTADANQRDAYTLNTSAEAIDSALSVDRCDRVERPLLNASSDEQNNLEGLASQPALDTKGLSRKEDKHITVEKDLSEFRTSISDVTHEERAASNANTEHAISATTATGRRTGKVQQKKDDNLFWLIIRAFVVSMSKLWAK